jgi:hypothetical protein
MTLRLLAATLVLAAVPLSEAQAASRSCQRGGAELEQASGNVRIVRKELPLRRFDTRREAVLGCWVPTGRRRTLIEERDLGDDLVTSSHIEIVDGRYAGVIATFTGGVTESTRARLFDVRNRRTVHESTECAHERGDFSGPDDVVFLPGGGMAFSCNRLLMFRDRSSTTPQELEPDGTDVRQLAVATNARNFGSRLYWTVEIAGTPTARSLVL